MVIEYVGRCACRKICSSKCPLLHTSKSPWFLLVLEKKATCQHKEKAEKRQHEKGVTLCGRFQIRVSSENYKREHSLRSKWNAGPVRLCFSPTPALSSSLGNGTQGHSSPETGHSFEMSLCRSCTDTGVWCFSPNPPSSSRVSGAVGAAGPASKRQRAPARGWDTGSTCDFAFGGSALPAAPRAGSGCLWGA